MAANVGLDPVKDVRWVTSGDPLELFTQGNIDAFLGFPPEPQELRNRGVGHVIVNTAIDRPWSQYFCCMLAGSQDYVRKYPVATKRVLRAVLKAADLCAADPARTARRLVDGGFDARYDYALQTLREVRTTGGANMTQRTRFAFMPFAFMKRASPNLARRRSLSTTPIGALERTQ